MTHKLENEGASARGATAKLKNVKNAPRAVSPYLGIGIAFTTGPIGLSSITGDVP